ncbi:Hypothetical predicted protein [Marmota monax]|uniref:Uncharacterized protein n=1 Tax=Marmota monax TaxID=9995 RepID=A0A5E4B1B5_MARMO|nr:hypothetical protein GHT09_003954 [Marmota monax]VTJ63523.1 Hypothetical predicted protein [Marmota monax]
MKCLRGQALALTSGTPTHTHSHQVLWLHMGRMQLLPNANKPGLTLSANKNPESLKEMSRVSGDQFNQNLKGFTHLVLIYKSPRSPLAAQAYSKPIPCSKSW